MKSRKTEQERDFIMRQYASLTAGGLSSESARVRLSGVMGNGALSFLEEEHRTDVSGNADTSTRLAKSAMELGGNAADTHAAFVRSAAEARLFALDWWRPIRTFLLYILFLLALAIAIAVYMSIDVLSAYRLFALDVGMHGGAASWILSAAAIRLFGPLLVIAILLVVLAAVWYWMRLRIATLRPLAGSSRFPWLYGRSGSQYRALLCLEYASILREGGARNSDILGAAMRLVHCPDIRFLRTREGPVGDQLEQAMRLGTLTDELDWQRRLYWSAGQSQLELSRDRLILFSRVIFYLLIGYMVTILYLPVFSIATMFGEHL